MRLKAATFLWYGHLVRLIGATFCLVRSFGATERCDYVLVRSFGATRRCDISLVRSFGATDKCDVFFGTVIWCD